MIVSYDTIIFYLEFSQNIEIVIDSTILKGFVSFLCKAFVENTEKDLHYLVVHLSYVGNCAAAFGERERTTFF